MKSRLFSIGSVIAILLVSWANIVYFGYGKRNHFSPLINQLVHFGCLSLTCVIGYLNWRGKEKWLNVLWLSLYAFVGLATSMLLAAYVVAGHHIHPFLKTLVIGMRNRFTEPVPFLVFLLLQRMAGGFLGGAGKRD